MVKLIKSNIEPSSFTHHQRPSDVGWKANSLFCWVQRLASKMFGKEIEIGPLHKPNSAHAD